VAVSTAEASAYILAGVLDPEERLLFGSEPSLEPVSVDEEFVMAGVDRVPNGRDERVGVPEDPGLDDPQKADRVAWQYGTFFSKGQSMGTGQAPVKRYNRQLRDLIIAGEARPSFIVSHEIPLAQAPDAYDKFDQRIDGYTKVLLKPNA
jgi:hypothetical protein